MLLPALAKAQEPPPQFTMEGNGAQAGYTDTTSIYSNWTWPTIVNCPNNDPCHIEYCFTQHPAGYPGSLDYCTNHPAAWGHSNYSNTSGTPFTLNLSIGANPYTVCAEYRLVDGSSPPYTFYPSNPACTHVTYNPPTNGPTVSVTSPVGITDPKTGPQQPQFLDADYAQAVTYTATSPVESVTAAVAGCTPPTTCAAPFITGFAPAPGAPYLWEWSNILSWAQNNPSTGGYYIQVTATDQANNSTPSPPPASATSLYFNLFDASTAPQSLTCTASPINCVTLGDGTGANSYQYDITGDPPDGTYMSCPNPPNPQIIISFAGYADPSMRADSVITSDNPWGTNLWLMYSFAKLAHIASPCDYTGVVETHLAESTDGGQSWGAWCNGCSGFTAIYPSLSLSSCYINNSYIIDYSGPCYTSHEVPTFWQNASTNTVYAAHLMYNIPPAGYTTHGGVQYAITDGCLVISMVTGPPNNLAWLTTSTQPQNCQTTTLPNDNGQYNVFLQFSTMTSLANPTGGCSSWGEPAIMVSSLPTGSPLVYLAAECFQINSGQTQGQGYYIFVNDPTLNNQGTGGAPNGGWSVYNFPGSSTPFTFSLAQLPPNAPSYPANTFLTAFDWAVRPDATVVALVSPESPQSGASPMWGPCLALEFNFQASAGATPGSASSVFPLYIGSVQDSDPPMGGVPGVGESYGPNGCTYEPTSNTGVAIVRHIENTALVFPNNSAQFQQYSIIMSGLLP